MLAAHRRSGPAARPAGDTSLQEKRLLGRGAWHARTARLPLGPSGPPRTAPKEDLILLPAHTASQISADQSVVVFRALPGTGDFLCAVPALAALRGALPRGRLVLVGLESTRELVERYGNLVDELVAFPGHPDLPEQEPDWPAIPRFYEEIRERRFDWAIQLHGTGWTVNRIVERFGGARMAGFRPEAQSAPDPHTFPVWREAESEVNRWLRLVGLLGVDPTTAGLAFPIKPADRAAIGAIAGVPGQGEAYAVVHPGASAPERRWPAAAFARVGDALAGTGLTVVLTGSAAEAALTWEVARAMSSAAVDLGGQTDLGSLAALLAGATILVGNDTGVSHLAAALRVRSVIVFSGTDPTRWAPPDRELHRPVRADLDEALREVRALLARPAGRAA